MSEGSKYGEPWSITEEFGGQWMVGADGKERCSDDDYARCVSCVNACEGFDDLQEMRRLAVAMKLIENHFLCRIMAMGNGALYVGDDMVYIKADDVIAAGREIGAPEAAMLEEKK